MLFGYSRACARSSGANPPERVAGAVVSALSQTLLAMMYHLRTHIVDYGNKKAPAVTVTKHSTASSCCLRERDVGFVGIRDAETVIARLAQWL
uniref:Uncharacterized protein n=1 Tax=Mycobacterium riyadhense TaxID=486698 RepID=A0A653EZ00_9MYCO|nr:hypothetical protein BIN_B_04582 [Mycobacterium riyadhense]